MIVCFHRKAGFSYGYETQVRRHLPGMPHGPVAGTCWRFRTRSLDASLLGATLQFRTVDTGMDAPPQKTLNRSTIMRSNCDLTDSQWAALDPLIPEPSRRKDHRGRPLKDRRAVLDGIVWVLRTGAPWADLPDRYPPYQTCHRRFQQWVRSGILKGVFEALAADLHV